MPTQLKRAKTSTDVSSSKGVGKLLAEFDVWDVDNFQISNDELDTMITELQTATNSRTKEEIDEINQSKFETAIKSIQFCRVQNEKPVLAVDEVKEKDKIETGIDKQILKEAVKSSIIFAFVHGNVTSKKYWVKCSHESESDKKAIYFSLPLLNTIGSRSVLVHVYRNEISSFLEKGKKNTLAAVLEKAEIKVKDNKRKYLFPKGHLLAEKEMIDPIRTDLNHIFEQMKLPIEKRKFELKWFVV